MSDARDDFYVGYLDEAPPDLARFVRRRVSWILLVAVLMAGALVATLRPFATSNYEFGNELEFEGVLVETPVPALLLDRPGATGGSSRYLLSGLGKFGAQPDVEGFDQKRVRLTGTLVHRDDQTMVELVAGSIEVLDPAPATPIDEEVELGQRTVSGEIVDSKCFLGVMKPGNLKPHRACAVRCISGGVPPVLLVRDPEGNATYLHLLGADGSSIGRAILDRVAEPVTITGRLTEQGERHFLYADPESIRRAE